MSFTSTLGMKKLIAKVNQTDGKRVTQSFDANNNLLCRKDAENRVVLASYNATNQKMSETEGLLGNDCAVCLANPASCAAPMNPARTTTYSYRSPALDAVRFLRRPSVAPGQTFETEMVYGDARFTTLPTAIIQRGFTPAGTAVARTINLTYTNAGQVSTINGPRAPSDPGMTGFDDITILDYNACTTGDGCGQLSKVTNALGHITTYDAYHANGRVTQSTDPNGLRTTYVYDARGRTRFMTRIPPTGTARTTEYRYDVAGNVRTAIFPDGVTLTYTYDAAWNLARVADNAGNRIVYHYDLKGNRTQEATYSPNNTLARQLDRVYDIRNRVATLNDGGAITQQVNDALGNLTRVTDAKQTAAASGISTRHSYDALDRLLGTIDNLGGVASYRYDSGDRLTQAVAPNNATTQYAFDDLGNLRQETSADRGSTSYNYDSAGNLTQSTDARGVVINARYDALNRRSTIDYATDTDVSFSYDAGATCASGMGRLCQVIDESGATRYAYDAFGNITEQRKTELSKTYVTRYSYDAGDRILTLTYPDNRLIRYLRDSVGRIQSVTGTVNGAKQTIVSNRAYRADGLLLNETYGNGLNEFRQYDLRGQLNHQSLGTADIRDYGYDPNGNLIQQQSLVERGNYVYDVLDRLSKDSITTTTTSGHAYTYDANGNRLKKASTAYSYDPNSNRLTQVGASDVGLDGAGNTVINGAFGYSYSQAGRLRQVTSGAVLQATYTYNYLGQRTRKVAGSTTTVYHRDFNGDLLLETSGTAVVRVAYVYADTTPLADIARAASVDSLTYIHTDHLNTPRLATNAAQTVVWQWAGRAFGDTMPNQNPDGDALVTTINLRYPGQYFDAETGLHYNLNRYYSPTNGRYNTADPIGLIGGINPYTYTVNNPLRWIDPTGLDATVTYYQGRNGNVFGHIGVGVNTPNTAGFNPSPGASTSKVLTGRDVPGVVSPDAGHTPLQTITVPFTPEQDQAMQNLINQRRDNPGNYNLYSRQCTGFVSDVLRAGGMDCGNPTKPQTLISNRQINYTLPNISLSV